ncbi:MAG: FkbM family methyltransferase [Geobacter sp.]|nr:FkbM family methyltransferase [Geobacter sp.]
MEPIITEIPNQNPIELISYYECFKELYRKCELETKEWFVHNIKDGWCIFDCGANIGYYSILFSRLSPNGRIHAFEPTSTIHMLAENLRYNNIHNVTMVNKALGVRSGLCEENVYRIWGQQPELRPYPFITIDEYVAMNSIDRVDCMKIDVDSFDFDVLRGSERTLLYHNPYVVVELNHALGKRGQTVEQALIWLATLNYNRYLLLDNENYVFKRDY